MPPAPVPPIPLVVVVVPMVVVLFCARCWSALFCDDDELVLPRDVLLALEHVLQHLHRLLRIAVLHLEYINALVAVRRHVQIRHHARNFLHQILWRRHDDRLDARVGHGGDLRRFLDALLAVISCRHRQPLPQTD